MKSGKDPLSLTLTWFWRDNDIFLAGHDVLYVPVMPVSPCCSWHTEQPILHEPHSAHPTERGFCYIDVKTGIHCQASSLRIPSSPSSHHDRVYSSCPSSHSNLLYCQPGCLRGGVFLFPFWHIQVLHDASFTYCLLWGWREKVLPCHHRSQHKWEGDF